MTAVNAPDRCDPDALIQYLDDDLSPKRRQAVGSHLQECAVCRGELADLQGILCLTDMPAPAAMNQLQARALEHRVRQGVRERYAPGLRRRSWTVSLGSAAAGAVALLLVLIALERLSPAGEPGFPVADDSGVFEVDSRSVESDDETVELISDIDEFLMDTASADELLAQMESLVEEEALLALLEEEYQN
jgi:hypothetical protein